MLRLFNNGAAFSIALISLFFAAHNASAEEVYSWKKCVELTLQNNAELRSVIASEQSIKASIGTARSNFLPQLTASSTSTRSNSDQLTPLNSNTVSIGVSQNLFAGFQDAGKIAQAKANVAVAQANIIATKAKISRDLKAAYEGLNYAKEYLALLKDIIRRREDNMNIIKMRFKGGMENKGSVLLAEAYFADAKYNLIQAQNLKEISKAQLCKVMGFTECKDFDIKDAVPIKDLPSKLDFDIIIKDTPQHAQAIAQEQAAKAGITIAESGFFPNLNLVGAVGKRGTTFAPQDNYWSVGVNLSFPFFTGGRDYYAVQGAVASKSAATYTRENIDRQILADLRQGYSTYLESVTRLEVTKSYKEASQMRADIARKKYNNGLLTFEDWDVIENDLINRQTNYLQSRRDRVISEAAWEQIQGKGAYND